MALDEVSYPAAKLSVSATPLPLNTPPKAVKWKHMEGAFHLTLQAVSSRMRLQIKQGGKVHVTSTYNKLTPAQKKNLGAPRLQYQDKRVSLRYPSSSQVDNGLSERFQLTLDDPSSVLAIVKKLTPFFVIVPPASLPAPTPTTTSTALAEASGSKKRKNPGDSDEVDSSASLPQKKKRKESETGQAESQAGSSGPGSSQRISPSTAHTQITPSSHTVSPSTQVLMTKSTTPPKQTCLPFAQARPAPPVDPAIEALKAQLLQGISEPEPQSATPPSTSKATSSPPQPTSEPPTFKPAIESNSTQTKPDFQKFRQDLAGTPISGNTSIEQVEVEIDLLPRSPLIDTATPQFTQIPTQTQSTRINAYPSLTGIDFTDVGELLNCAFPPMRTAEEEEVERRRVESDAEEWGDLGSGHEQTVSLGSSTLSALNRMSISLNITDDEIYDSLDRGELNDGFLAIQDNHITPAPVPPGPSSYITPPSSNYNPTPVPTTQVAPHYQFYQPTQPRRNSDYTPRSLYYGHSPPQDDHLRQHPAYDRNQYQQDYEQYRNQYANYDSSMYATQEHQQYQEPKNIDDIDD